MIGHPPPGQMILPSQIAPPLLRHPLDPEPALSTKAAAALTLAIIGLCTAPVVGGLIPASIALLLARAARAELVAARGFLTGAGLVRAATVLAWIAIVLVVTILVVGASYALLHDGSGGGGERDYPSRVN